MIANADLHKALGWEIKLSPELNILRVESCKLARIHGYGDSFTFHNGSLHNNVTIKSTLLMKVGQPVRQLFLEQLSTENSIHVWLG